MLWFQFLDTEERVDLNELEPKHFEPWVTWAKENGRFF
jgi:L-rhamnose isomerase